MMKQLTSTLKQLAVYMLCVLVVPVTACSSKEKKTADSMDTTQVRTEEATTQPTDSAEAARLQREEASKQFCRQLSVEDLLVLLTGGDVEKTGLTLVYEDSEDSEENELENYEVKDVVYGRDIEKTTKKELGYDLKATSGHSCFFNIFTATSTNASLNFGNKEDAEDFLERAAKHEPVKIGDTTYYFHQKPDAKGVYIEKPYADNDFSTEYVLYPPKLEDGFYRIEIEVYS